MDTGLSSTAYSDDKREKYVVDTEDISDAEMCSVMEDYERSQLACNENVPDSNGGASAGAYALDKFNKPRSEDEMNELGKKRIGESTATKILWARKAYDRWVDYRRKMYIGRHNFPQLKFRQVDRLDKSVLHEVSLNRDMCDFIVEVRKENGEEYPPGTVYDLVLMLSIYLEQEYGIKHLTTTAWPKIRNTLDWVMQEKTAQGLGQQQERDYVTAEQEEDLWSHGFLGDSDPDKLRLTIFFLLGKFFALRGGKEHRNLVRYPRSQFTIKPVDGDKNKLCLEYREFTSKMNQGGLSSRNVKKPRVVFAFENEARPDRCPVKLFIKYVRFCPIGTDESTAFYLRTNVNWQQCPLWYTCQPIGKNQLNDYLKNLMRSAGYFGNFTNHSLRATTATRLFHGKCDEQLIAEQTGHSSNAIRRYKKSNIAQKQDVSRILSGEKKTVDNDVQSEVKEPEKSAVNSENVVQVTGQKNVQTSVDNSAENKSVDVNFPNVERCAGLVNINFHFHKQNIMQFAKNSVHFMQKKYIFVSIKLCCH